MKNRSRLYCEIVNNVMHRISTNDYSTNNPSRGSEVGWDEFAKGITVNTKEVNSLGKIHLKENPFTTLWSLERWKPHALLIFFLFMIFLFSSLKTFQLCFSRLSVFWVLLNFPFPIDWLFGAFFWFNFISWIPEAFGERRFY